MITAENDPTIWPGVKSELSFFAFSFKVQVDDEIMIKGMKIQFQVLLSNFDVDSVIETFYIFSQ